MDQTEAKPEQPDGRIPRPALAVVAVGLLLSAVIFWIAQSTGGSSAEIQWDAVEAVKTPPAEKLGSEGSLGLARTSVSAMAPDSEGSMIFQVAGVVRINSGGKVPTALRCDVTTMSDPESAGDDPESFIARTPKRRAAWPRPSEDLLKQEVPELAIVRFNAGSSANSGLPIRDVFRRYTDSASRTLVDWDGYEDRTQNWIWTMPDGAGEGGATLGYAVVFRAVDRPEAEIDCRARTAPVSGKPARSATIRVPVRLGEWPVTGDSPAPGAGSQAPDVG